jgi:hypothetical protein
MSTNNTIIWPYDGKTYTVTPVSTPGSGLVIPSDAKTSGILDNAPKWKAEKDAGTPGSVSSTFNKFISTEMGRQFNAVQTGKAGMRWSNPFAEDPVPTNFVYDLTVQSPDWGQMGQLELDMNQMMESGQNCFLCLQVNFVNGCWDYTTVSGGGTHWTHSTMKVNRKDWPANTWKHLRLKTSRDAVGVVTYEGVEIDGVYTLFDPSCKGPSASRQNWTPGVLINNYQTNGANASGTMNSYAKQMQILYW